MGFLQKFFTIGGRRSKKKQPQIDIPEAPSIPDLRRQHDDHEATVNRMLRSTSAHFAAIDDGIDSASLPPMPQLFRHTPTASVTSLASTIQRGTYTVKVYPRTTLTKTDFPNANPPMRQDSLTPKRPNQGSLRHRSKSVPITPRDKTRMLGLRQDPSVASLLNVYDEHGCLDSKIFSNSFSSPGHEGKLQKVKNGTGTSLRQLLGNPPSLSSNHARNNSAAEGDISWAERFLAGSANSSASSLPLQTPNDALYPDAHFTHNHTNNTFSTGHDITINNTSDLYPLFSSLQVELSTDSDGPLPSNYGKFPPEDEIGMTPQKASDIFSFLSARKSISRKPYASDTHDRPLPSLPIPAQSLTSRFSSYSSTAGSHEQDMIPTSDDTHATHSATSTKPYATESNFHAQQTPYNPSVTEWPTESNWLIAPPSRTRSQSTSTSIISRENLRDGPKAHQVTNAESVRGPRGPRPRPLPICLPASAIPFALMELHDTSNDEERASVEETPQTHYAAVSATDLSALLNDDSFAPMVSRSQPRELAARAIALASHQQSSNNPLIPTSFTLPTTSQPYIPRKQIKRKPPVYDKENDSSSTPTFAAEVELPPITPIRLSSVFRSSQGAQPSPASSSDLSPVAQQLMADLRTQRMCARERERKTGKWGNTTSRLKW